MRSRRARSIADKAAIPLAIGGVALAAAEAVRRTYRQNQLFCPSSEPLRGWDPSAYGIPEGAAEEHWISTADGERLHAWYCRAPHPVASGIFCHGNTGNLTTSADMIPHLLRAGLSVLFFDYRGFGKSSGRPSLRGVVADGVAAATFHDRIRPANLPSVLYGFSLGGAIAAQVIRKHPFDALILQSTFTSLTEIARVLFPYIPLHLLARNSFDTIGVVRRLKVPLLVLHGTEDEVVPFHMGKEIFAGCTAPKRIHLVEAGLHKDLFDREADALVEHIARFVAGLPAHRRSSAVDEAAAIEPWITGALRRLRAAF